MEKKSRDAHRLRTAGSLPLNFVWISLEQGMQCRSHYYQYGVDRALRRADLEDVTKSWGATQTQGPGNFHLPEHLDSHLDAFVSFENMFTSGTSTVTSLRGGFTGVPGVLHALAHSPKTSTSASALREYPTVFERLVERGYQLAGFHLFKDVAPDFVIPDFNQGWTDALQDLPDPHTTHVNYVAPVLRLENHLDQAGDGPHAICIHVFGQLAPAILDVLAAHDITAENSVIVIVGDHGHPNYDLEGRQWRGAHDFECDEMNTHVYCRLAYPGSTPKQIENECSTLDLFPTFASLLGFDPQLPDEFSALLGDDLTPVLNGDGPEAKRSIRISNRYHSQLRSRVTSLRRDGWRYQYMHRDNVYLHDYHRLNGVRMLAPENLYRCGGDGFESPVNIENTRIQAVLQEFRRVRLENDKLIQRFWLRELARETDVSVALRATLEAIDPNANDLREQIRLSEEVDTAIRDLAEKTLGRRVDTIGELKRIVDSKFYYQHVLAEFPEAKHGRVAVWDVDGGYDACIRPIRDRLDAQYVVVEDESRWQDSIDGLPVRGPTALSDQPVDLLVICAPASQLRETVDKIRSMDLPHQPMIG